MKLFTFSTSPYARKVRMMLEYKGLECEMAERCYSLDRKPDLRDASERAEVPVLVLDDGRTIADSTIICEYLEDAHPRPPVFPADPFERARMRAIDDLCDRTFDATVFGYFLGVVRSTAPESKAMQDAGRAEFKASARAAGAASLRAAISFAARRSHSPTSPRSVICRWPMRCAFR